MIVSMLAVVDLATDASSFALFDLRIGFVFFLRFLAGLSRGLHRSAVVVDRRELCAARRGELRLERLVGRVLRIECVERRVNVGAVGKLAQDFGGVRRLLVEIDRAADAGEGHAADAGMADERQHRIGHGQLVGGELCGIGIVEFRRRVVGRVEAIGGDLGEEACRLLGPRLGFAFGCPKRGEIPVAVEHEHAGAVLLARHILLKPGFREFFQLLRDGTKLGRCGVGSLVRRASCALSGGRRASVGLVLSELPQREGRVVGLGRDRAGER